MAEKLTKSEYGLRLTKSINRLSSEEMFWVLINFYTIVIF